MTTTPQQASLVLTEEQIDAICAPGRAERWKGDVRQYDRDTVRLVLEALAASGEAARVPEPTEEMLVAGLKECEPLGELIDWREGFGRDDMRSTFNAMLAAAPKAPASASAEVVRPEPSCGWQAHAEDLERAVQWYRQRLAMIQRHKEEEPDVWYWQNDGEDHLESMVAALPVVIRADHLRALIAASAGKQAPSGGEADSVSVRINEAAQQLPDEIKAVLRVLPGLTMYLAGHKTARSVMMNGISKEVESWEVALDGFAGWLRGVLAAQPQPIQAAPEAASPSPADAVMELARAAIAAHCAAEYCNGLEAATRAEKALEDAIYALAASKAQPKGTALTDEQAEKLLKDFAIAVMFGSLEDRVAKAAPIKAVLTAAQAPAPAPERDEDDQWTLDRAADLLEGYAAYIRNDGSENLQYHPYIPEVEMVAANLRIFAAKPVTQAPAVAPTQETPR